MTRQAEVDLETVTPQRKGIAVTRSFSRSVTTLDALLAAVTSYAFRAGEKLRRHELAASHLTVFAHSNLFNGDPPFSASVTEGLIEASSDGLVLIAAATRGAKRLWRPGAKLAKAGVILDDLVRAQDVPTALIGGRNREKAALVLPLTLVRSRCDLSGVLSLVSEGVGRQVAQG